MIYTGMDEDEFEHVETLAKVVAPYKLVARAMSMPSWMLACLHGFLPTNHTLALADMHAYVCANVRACVPACLAVCAPIVCLPICLSAWAHVRMPWPFVHPYVCLPICLSAWAHVRMRIGNTVLDISRVFRVLGHSPERCCICDHL
jgi:hypothetical protein